MNLQKKHRRDYNMFMQHCNMPDGEAMVLLIPSTNDDGEAGFDFEEVEFDDLDAGYNFLHDTLGWVERMAEHQGSPSPKKHSGMAIGISSYGNIPLDH